MLWDRETLEGVLVVVAVHLRLRGDALLRGALLVLLGLLLGLLLLLLLLGVLGLLLLLVGLLLLLLLLLGHGVAGRTALARAGAVVGVVAALKVLRLAVRAYAGVLLPIVLRFGVTTIEAAGAGVPREGK